MSPRKPTNPDAPQNRLLFWFAAALVPEAGSFHVESARAMAQRAELIRQAEANEPFPDPLAEKDEHARRDAA